MLPVLIASFLLTAAANADDSNQRYSYTSKGCGKPLPCEVEKGISKDCTIDSKSGASPRTYRIHVPESYKGTEPVPLIFSFHGRTQTPEYQEQLSQFSNSSYGFEGISVYPQGVPVRFSISIAPGHELTKTRATKAPYNGKATPTPMASTTLSSPWNS